MVLSGLYLSLSGCAAPHELHATLDSDPLERLDLERPVITALGEVARQQSRSLSVDVACAQCHERQAREYAYATMRYGFISPSFNALELSLNQLRHHASTIHLSQRTLSVVIVMVPRRSREVSMSAATHRHDLRSRD